VRERRALSGPKRPGGATAGLDREAAALVRPDLLGGYRVRENRQRGRRRVANPYAAAAVILSAPPAPLDGPRNDNMRGCDLMKVRDAMSSSVRAVKADTKVLEVASLMCLYRYHGLPVVDDEDRLIGVIAEKDVLHCLFPTIENLVLEGMHSVDLDRQMRSYTEVLEQTVEEMMTRNPISVTPDMHLLRAATIMVKHNFRRIPVADGGRLVGMLTLGDVHKAIFHANVTGTLKAR
jgi:CBS domain-containing protein